MKKSELRQMIREEISSLQINEAPKVPAYRQHNVNRVRKDALARIKNKNQYAYGDALIKGFAKTGKWSKAVEFADSSGISITDRQKMDTQYEIGGSFGISKYLGIDGPHQVKR